MAGTLQESTARKGVTFELTDATLDQGTLYISGYWSGVRGLRFVRPTLVVDDRQILATLDHKPWAPNGGKRPWMAAFPWDGDLVDVGEIELAVAPSVAVPLVPAGAEAEVADEVEDAERAEDAERVEAEVEQLRAQAAEARAELSAVCGERDRALAERDEAIGARKSVEAERDEALAARIAAEAERESATTRYDQALATSKQALAARDAAVAERAHLECALAARRNAEKPLGVRTVTPPHAAALVSEDGPETSNRRDLARLDVWAVRLFGLIGAACFLLLLALLIKLYF